jgi:membrane-associated phospholipid phosphatase
LPYSLPKRRSRSFSARAYRNTLIVGLAGLFLFILIAVDVAADGAITVLDARINTWLHDHGTRRLITFFLFIGFLHTDLTITLLMAAILAYLWSRHLRRWAATFALTVFGGMLLNFLLKVTFARTRPSFEVPFIREKTFSFPSGHTILATVFWGTLCIYAFSCTRDKKKRVLMAALCFSLIALVGFSRMYVGAHYLSDVMGAFLEGVAWIASSLLIVKLVRRAVETE